MALKGNLLYNGDFETGTTEGWELGAFGLPAQHTLTASEEAKLRGNYGGLLTANTNFAQSYLAYNKICSFEEHEAYLFICPFNMVNGFYNLGYLYGLDDKGNLIKDFYLSYDSEAGDWKVIKALLRGFGEITHFQVGLWTYRVSAGDKLYFDEVKLIPLRSIKGHVLADYKFFDNMTSNKKWYVGIGCIGKCKLRSIVRTANVSGTDPTLDIKIDIGLLENIGTARTLQHTQFTGEGVEEKIIDLPEASTIDVEYTVGGTDPSFDVYHHIRLEPY